MTLLCDDNICGIVRDPLKPAPTEPSSAIGLTAVAAFGGIYVSWVYPQQNPEGVKHFLLYRSKSQTISSQPFATVGGNSYFDPIDPSESANTFYYWLRVISYSGTEGALVGPASARPYDTITNLMHHMSQDIANSPIGRALMQSITPIVASKQDFAKYVEMMTINNKAMQLTVSENTALKEKAVLAALKVNSDILKGTEALHVSTDKLIVATNKALSAIETVNKQKIGYSAKKVGNIYFEPKTKEWIPYTGTNESRYSLVPFDGDGITDVYSSIINAYTKAGSGNAYDTKLAKLSPSQQADLVKTWTEDPVAQEEYWSYLQYKKDPTLIIDAKGVQTWNALHPTDPLVWIAGMPLASAAKNIQIDSVDKSGNDNRMMLSEALEAHADATGRLMGQYHVKMESNGVISGFGLAHYDQLLPEGKSKTQSTFLVNASTFAIAPPNVSPSVAAQLKVGDTATLDKYCPFIVQTEDSYDSAGNKIPAGTYIKEAFIDNLTFTKLIATDHSFEVTAGKYDPATRQELSPPSVYAKNMTVDKLKVKKNDDAYMEVTGEVIKIIQNGVVRVKIGNLSL